MHTGRKRDNRKLGGMNDDAVGVLDANGCGPGPGGVGRLHDEYAVDKVGGDRSEIDRPIVFQIQLDGTELNIPPVGHGEPGGQRGEAFVGIHGDQER